MSKKGGRKNMIVALFIYFIPLIIRRSLFLMPNREDQSMQKAAFVLYLLQFKRFSWSRSLLETEGPNGIKKS